MKGMLANQSWGQVVCYARKRLIHKNVHSNDPSHFASQFWHAWGRYVASTQCFEGKPCCVANKLLGCDFLMHRLARQSTRVSFHLRWRWDCLTSTRQNANGAARLRGTRGTAFGSEAQVLVRGIPKISYHVSASGISHEVSRNKMLSIHLTRPLAESRLHQLICTFPSYLIEALEEEVFNGFKPPQKLPLCKAYHTRKTSESCSVSLNGME